MSETARKKKMKIKGICQVQRDRHAVVEAVARTAKEKIEKDRKIRIYVNRSLHAAHYGMQSSQGRTQLKRVQVREAVWGVVELRSEGDGLRRPGRRSRLRPAAKSGRRESSSGLLPEAPLFRIRLHRCSGFVPNNISVPDTLLLRIFLPIGFGYCSSL